MKALKVLYIHRNTEILHGSCCREEYMQEINEAISELEALQHRSCEGCKYLYINKHSEFVEYCTNLSIEIPYSDIATFFCNRYEPKGQ